MCPPPGRGKKKTTTTVQEHGVVAYFPYSSIPIWAAAAAAFLTQIRLHNIYRSCLYYTLSFSSVTTLVCSLYLPSAIMSLPGLISPAFLELGETMSKKQNSPCFAKYGWLITSSKYMLRFLGNSHYIMCTFHCLITSIKGLVRKYSSLICKYTSLLDGSLSVPLGNPTWRH